MKRNRVVIAVMLYLLPPIALLAQFSPPVLLKDVVAGSANSQPFCTMTFNGKFHFNADYKPFVSDGTPGGTFQLKDLWTYGPYAEYKGLLYLYGEAGKAHTPGLYKSNGSTAGTTLLKSGLYPIRYAVANGYLFFIHQYMRSNITSVFNELWRTDGTSKGTILLKAFTSSTGSQLRQLLPAGSQVFVMIDNIVNGMEWWVSNGTVAGTTMVADINPAGPSYPQCPSTYPWPGYCSWVTFGPSATWAVWNNVGAFYFLAFDGSSNQLWRSTGTGATKITNINSTGNFFPHNFCQIGQYLYFSADDGENGFELWQWDLATSTASLVANINPTGSSWPVWLTAVGSKLFFAANDGVTGFELYTYDGTNPPSMVRDINATGSAWPNGMRMNSWTPRTFAQYNGRIYFMADDGVHGVEPWTSDGTAAGTVMVADIAPGSASAFTNTENAWLTTAGNKMMFSATDGVTGLEPWAVSGLPKMMAGRELPAPSGLELEQNYPNPFNPSTTIAFGLPQSSHARLRVYDAHGRIVATLVEGDLPAGRHEVAFDASSLPSGMYMYRLDADGRTLMNKMSLVK